jgi:H+/gluconate symporter-like permease
MTREEIHSRLMAVARPFAWIVLAVVAVSLARALFTDVPPDDVGRLAFIIGFGGILMLLFYAQGAYRLRRGPRA